MKRPYWTSIQLEGKEESSFEKALLNWINFKVKWYPNSVLVFNHKDIVTNDEKTTLGPNKRVCNKVFGETTIKYLRVTQSMCILLKVTNSKDKQLYKIPETWDNADCWYMY